MGFPVWLGIAVGFGIVGLHAASRVLTHRLALQASTRRAFMVWELGGLGGRMALVFCAVALVLLYVPVHAAAFVGTVLVLLVGSMVIETGLIIRSMDRGSLEP